MVYQQFNGYTLLESETGYKILHFRTPHKVISIRCLVDAGSSKETAKEWGIAHYLEHMFFKGTKNKDVFEVNNLLAEIGSGNAYTANTRTLFRINTIAESFVDAANLLLEMLFEPRFDQECFEKERGVIKEEIQARADAPTSYFFDRINNYTYDTGRYHPTCGTKETVDALTINDLKQFRNKHYSNMIFIVVGDVSLKLVEHLKDCLNKQPRTNNDPSTNPNNKVALNFDRHTLHHKADQAILAITTKGVFGKEMVNSRVQGLFGNAFGGDSHSMLFRRIREELGLCYSVGMYFGNFGDTGFTRSYVLLDQKNLPQAEEEILKLLKQVREAGISDKLLKIAKHNYLFNLADRFQDCEAFAQSLCDHYFVQDETVTSYEEEKANISKTTNKDIIEWANRFLKENEISVAWMTKG